MTAVIQVEELRKRYREVTAVDGIGFEVAEREVFGIVGPNGAGKTTTVEIVEGLRRPDGGRVRVLGLDPGRDGPRLRQRIGAQLQKAALPDRLKVWEALDLYASFYDRAVPWPELLDQWGLADRRGAAVGTLSGGERQRLLIALALVGRPRAGRHTRGRDRRGRPHVPMGVTQLAPAGDRDRVEDVWDSPRWARLWDGLFYLTLAIPTVLTLAGGDGPVRSRAVTAALAAGFGAWYWAILVLHRDWWAGRRWPVVYLVVAAGFFWLLVARDSRYFILVYSLYPQVFGMLPDRWSYLGAAVVTVLPFAASGRLDHLEAGDLLSMVANLALALLVGLFIQAIAGQSERRREMIAELERARAENAALLARAREAAVLEERQRLAREIHDTLAQGLTGVVTQLEAAEAALQDRPEAAREHLDTARRLARESLGEARRSVNALRPGPLEQGRLVDAVAAVARGWSRASGVPATVTSVGQARPLPSETEVTLLRVAQEALANAGRHAAASAVALTLAFGDGQVSLDVTDDGVGFDPAAPPSGNGSGGYGLTAMRERVAALRGCLDVESGPGQGTTVVATIPAGDAG